MTYQQKSTSAHGHMRACVRALATVHSQKAPGHPSLALRTCPATVTIQAPSHHRNRQIDSHSNLKRASHMPHTNTAHPPGSEKSALRDPQRVTKPERSQPPEGHSQPHASTRHMPGDMQRSREEPDPLRTTQRGGQMQSAAQPTHLPSNTVHSLMKALDVSFDAETS